MVDKFWDQQDLHPKRKFRWLLYFDGMPQFVAKSVTKPGFSIGSTPHQFLQHTFNFPGRVTWSDVTLTIVDPVQPDSAASLYAILLDSGYVKPDQIQSLADGEGYGTIAKDKMVSRLGNKVRIEQIGIDSSNDVIESWTLFNPQITNVTFDTLDYTSDDLLNITIALKYDWASLNDAAPVGSDQIWPKTVID